MMPWATPLALWEANSQASISVTMLPGVSCVCTSCVVWREELWGVWTPAILVAYHAGKRVVAFVGGSEMLLHGRWLPG